MLPAYIAQPTDRDGHWLQPVIATGFVAADLVYTTPTQYASFVESLMTVAGETPAIRQLRESVLTDRKAEMCVGKLAKLCPDEVGFGPGWEVIKVHGKTFLMHTGLDDGVSTLGFFETGSRDGVVVFTNNANGPKVILPLLNCCRQIHVLSNILKRKFGRRLSTLHIGTFSGRRHGVRDEPVNGVAGAVLCWSATLETDSQTEGPCMRTGTRVT